jgi:hypothetical protein
MQRNSNKRARSAHTQPSFRWALIANRTVLIICILYLIVEFTGGAS